MRIIGRILSASALAAFALLAGSDSASAAEKTRVAVKGFNAKGVDASVAGTLETSFCSALADQNYDVLCPDDVRALMANKQQQLGLGQCNDNEEACIKSVSETTNATKVVTGEVSKLGEKYIISATMLDSASNKVLARAQETTTKLEDLLDKVGVLAKKFAGK